MGSALAAKPDEKKASSATREPASCKGSEWDGSSGASAGMPMFLQSGGCGCPECAAKAGIQAKLAVGQVGDQYERHADRVADAAASGQTLPSSTLTAPLPAPSGGSSIPAGDSGTPLSPDIRNRVEPSLGADLSHVRVHSSAADRDVARGFGAHAFTHGRDIWLGPAQSSSDVRLMSHEAAHVVQQGAAPGKAPSVQRRAADMPPSPSEDESAAKPDVAAFRQMVKDLPKNGRPGPGGAPASPQAGPNAPAPPGAEAGQGQKTGEPPDPDKLAQKKQEVLTSGQPAADKANQGQPQLSNAAQSAKTEAQKPSQPAKAGASAGAAAKPAAKSKGKGQGGGKAAGPAGAVSAGLQRPTTPPQVQPPRIAVPVDSAGKPLMPDPGGDAAILKLAMMAQAMRMKGMMLREQAAQERHNAGVIQGNIAKIHQGVAQAEEGIGQSEDHLSYRREVAGQAEGALQVAEQKADTVAAGAPQYQSKSAEGKAKSGPMAGEANGLSSENASKTPDDPDAAKKSQEQGQKLGKVGSDIGSMDDAMTQTKAKADSLAGDAAKAKQDNAQTKQNITGTQSTLDQTGAKLTQMTGQNAVAQAQLAAHASGPAQIAAGAASLDQQGLAAIQSSVEMEQRVHSAQQKYLDGMRSVPQSKRSKPAANGGPPVLIQRQADPAAPQPAERVDLNLAGKAVEALPSWLTGEEKQTEQQRAEAQAAEKQRRDAEIAEINAKAGGDFSKLSAADKAGIALSLTGRHLFGSVAGIKWPDFLGKMLQGLVDPRMALMGVVSGLSMVLSGAANLLSAEQWKKDPLGNLLKSAADIATGITVILGSITALAMAIIAILVAAAILTLGALGPLAAAVIPFCMTVVSTVGPWTITAAGIALELNVLVMIKDLVDAACADTAEKLQSDSDKVTEDAKNAGNMAMQIGMAAVGEAGGEALANTKFGQAVSTEMRGIGEDFGIVKPSAGGAPAVPGAAPVEPAAPAPAEAAPVPKGETAPAPAETAPAPKGEATPAPAEAAPAPKGEAAPTPGEAAPAPKGEAAPAPAETAPAPKGEAAPAPGETAPAPKGEAAPGTEAKPAEAPAEAKPAEAAGEPKPEDVAAEKPAADGHKVKVTKDGECLICTECGDANTTIKKEVEGSPVKPEEKAQIETDLEKANEIQDPNAKAEAVAEVQEEATEAVKKADEGVKEGEKPAETGEPTEKATEEGGEEETEPGEKEEPAKPGEEKPAEPKEGAEEGEPAEKEQTPEEKAAEEAKAKKLKEQKESLVEKTKAKAKALSDKASKEYMSNRQRGPVVAGVMDSQTGEVFFGINAEGVDPNLEPALADRLKAHLESTGGKSATAYGDDVVPGSHAEINALNKALQARKAITGRAVTQDELDQFLMHNRSLRGTRAGEGIPPRCDDCRPITRGVTMVDGD